MRPVERWSLRVAAEVVATIVVLAALRLLGLERGQVSPLVVVLAAIGAAIVLYGAAAAARTLWGRAVERAAGALRAHEAAEEVGVVRHVHANYNEIRALPAAQRMPMIEARANDYRRRVDGVARGPVALIVVEVDGSEGIVRLAAGPPDSRFEPGRRVPLEWRAITFGGSALDDDRVLVEELTLFGRLHLLVGMSTAALSHEARTLGAHAGLELQALVDASGLRGFPSDTCHVRRWGAR